MSVFEGNVVAEKTRVGIVVARFNEFITGKLLAGAMDGLKRHNVPEEDVDSYLQRMVLLTYFN